jgi:hypothetical protein
MQASATLIEFDGTESLRFFSGFPRTTGPGRAAEAETEFRQLWR